MFCLQYTHIFPCWEKVPCMLCHPQPQWIGPHTSGFMEPGSVDSESALSYVADRMAVYPGLPPPLVHIPTPNGTADNEMV